MLEPILRGVLYVGTVIACIALIGHLLRLRHFLAKMLAATMVVWAITATMLIIGVGCAVLGIPYPRWHFHMRTLNAALMFAVPVGLYIGLMRINGRGSDSGS